MAKYRQKTLLEFGMSHTRLAVMVRAGLLRYECGCKGTSCKSGRDECGILWTLSPPSSWAKGFRDNWKKCSGCKRKGCRWLYGEEHLGSTLRVRKR